MLGRIARWIDGTLHPAWYHGAARRPPYFEGWYFKMATADTSGRFAVIPGIFLSDDPQRQHAFVQVFDGVSGHATYHRYPAEQFHAAAGAFDVRIGPNRFTRRCIALDIADEQRIVRGELHFGPGESWPVRVAAPGVMGPFGWLPFMECYHGILSFDHAVSGTLHVDGQSVTFDGGRGYIEKDWGKSFPAGWVWMQTNHFARPGLSFTASIAVTPLLGGWFPGFLAGVWDNGAFYAFATYTGARTLHLAATEAHVEWAIEDSAYRLEVTAQRADATHLPGPDRLEMGKRVPETLKASVAIRLTDRRAGVVVVEGDGQCAGLEVAGDIDRLLRAVNGREPTAR